MITLELIKNIMHGHDVVDAQYIYDSLKIVENIAVQVKNFEKEINDENLRHEQKLKELKAFIIQIQAKCPHWTTEYYPDPSGNNDSYTVCKTCNKYL